MKALGFSATFGVVAGYGHDNNASAPAEVIVAAAWMAAMAEEFGTSGIAVGGVISPSRTAYLAVWGCPEGGEVTATVTGQSNPDFDKDVEVYKAAVLRMCAAVKAALQQNTVRVAFFEVVDFHYLKD